MAQLNFDASQVSPDTGTPDAVPAGLYSVLIDESEMKPTKDGNGAYLQLRLNIIDGEYAGRKIFDRLNIQNQNQVAQDIAFKRLSAIAHSVGVLHVQDSQQLHNIPLKVKVKVRAASGDYDASNEVKSYHNINHTEGPADVNASSNVPQGFAPQQPAQGNPWANAAPQGQQPQGQAAWQQPQQQFAQPQQQPQQAYQQPAPQQQPQNAPQQPWAAPQQAQQPWANAMPQQPQNAPQNVAQGQQPQGQAPDPYAQQAAQAQSAVPPWAQ